MSEDQLLSKVQCLSSEWMSLIRSDHHKDRDCHFYIETIWSYGEPPYFEVRHHGYIAPKYSEKFNSYEAALTGLLYFLETELKKEREYRKAEDESNSGTYPNPSQDFPPEDRISPHPF